VRRHVGNSREPFVDLKELTENPNYQTQKQNVLSDLNDDSIDLPIVGVNNGFDKLSYCFTLQIRNTSFARLKELLGNVKRKIG